METQNLFNLGVFLTLMLVFVNLIITKEITEWVPSWSKRVTLYLCLWTLPILGAIIAYRSAELSWFRKTSGTGEGQSGLSGGMLEFDSFFNPGAKHTAVTMQEEVHEAEETGEPKPDGIRVGNQVEK